MLVAEPLGTVDRDLAHRRHGRRRSRRSRLLRKLRHTFRSRRLRKGILSIVLAAFTVSAGYWASMYVASQHIPSADELNAGPSK